MADSSFLNTSVLSCLGHVRHSQSIQTEFVRDSWAVYRQRAHWQCVCKSTGNKQPCTRYNSVWTNCGSFLFPLSDRGRNTACCPEACLSLIGCFTLILIAPHLSFSSFWPPCLHIMTHCAVCANLGMLPGCGWPVHAEHSQNSVP